MPLFSATSAEVMQPAILTSPSSGTEVYTPSLCSGDPSTAPTSADTGFVVISLRSIKENSSKGLATIHEAGVVHGDIRESNILVDNLGDVDYIDFGFSQPFSSEEGREWEEWEECGQPLRANEMVTSV